MNTNLEASGPALTAQAGKIIVDLTSTDYGQDAYLLTAMGLSHAA
jgi:hypothetical protein